jgi:hypothetical protein
MPALRSLHLPGLERALGSIALLSPDFQSLPDFPLMREGGAALVDKTSAIADLLNRAAPGDAHRLFFARPRKLGKSLMLSIAGEMLAAGALPPGMRGAQRGARSGGGSAAATSMAQAWLARGPVTPPAGGQ